MQKFIINPLLFILEYFFKISGSVAAIIAMGAYGSFFSKLFSGYGSLLPALYNIFEFPEKSRFIVNVIQDYNTLTASAFNQRYGGQAVNYVMGSLNEAVIYLQSIYENISQQPIATLLAGGFAFLSLYITGRFFCFIRQKGQGSYLDRFERKLGNRVFKGSPDKTV